MFRPLFLCGSLLMSATAALPAALAAEPAPLSISRENVRLLPFDTRLNRVASVVGLPVGDKLFDGLRLKRMELGDFDRAKAINPDRSWTATRAALWVKTMRPICQSAAFKAKYPAPATDPTALIIAAYGRPPAAEELLAIKSGVAKATARDEVACLAVLSSLEMVAR